jgi:uncharacterized protein (TIGR02646 family)
MIPVTPQAEPEDFDSLVRQRGLGRLAEQGWSIDKPPPDASALPPYWRQVQRELWQRYSGICAYLSIYFEWALGAQSTDHFVAKSSHAGQAYEWQNYRLSCLGANRNKNRFDDVLDPLQIAPYTFVLNVASGAIGPNPTLDDPTRALAEKTIQRLKLDDPTTCRMRTQHVEDLLRGHVSADYLQRRSPFVWVELQRQGLLQ